MAAFDEDRLRDMVGLVDAQQERRLRIHGTEFSFEQQARPLSTGTRIWPSSVQLAAYLDASPNALSKLCPGIDISRCSVLELGAGCCGIGGIAFALAGAASVTVTDGDPEAVELLHANVAANQSRLPAAVHCCEYKWGQQEPSSTKAGLSPPYDILLGADIVNPDTLPQQQALVEALSGLSHPRTVTILAIQDRPYADIAGFRALLQARSFTVSETRLGTCGQPMPSSRLGRMHRHFMRSVLRPVTPRSHREATAASGGSARRLDESARVTLWVCTNVQAAGAPPQKAKETL
jgi:predicted nicotinamide N-methyase